MPRRHSDRDLLEEQHLARRIAYERDQRGMTPQSLASRMTAVGCPIGTSAIYKIEGDEQRQISVTELVGFSRVFGLPIAELLLPPEAVVDPQTKRLWQNLMAAGAKYQAATIEAANAHAALNEHTGRNPAAAEQIYQLLGDYEPGGTYWLPVDVSAFRATVAQQTGRDDVWQAWLAEHPDPHPAKPKVTTRRKGGTRG